MAYGDIEQMKDELEEQGEFFETDLYCPNCFERQETCDIEEAYIEGGEYKTECASCGKEFEFDTHVDICYYIRQNE